jgi:hypothetical protein
MLVCTDVVPLFSNNLAASATMGHWTIAPCRVRALTHTGMLHACTGGRQAATPAAFLCTCSGGDHAGALKAHHPRPRARARRTRVANRAQSYPWFTGKARASGWCHRRRQPCSRTVPGVDHHGVRTYVYSGSKHTGYPRGRVQLGSTPATSEYTGQSLPFGWVHRGKGVEREGRACHACIEGHGQLFLFPNNPPPMLVPFNLQQQ